MSKKGGSSASSDPFAGYAQIMQTQAAQQQMQLGADWLSFAKEQFAVGNERQKGVDELTNKVTTQQLADMERASQWATEDRARYKSVFQPLEDKFIDRANNWDSAPAQAKAAEEARADVLSNAAIQKSATDRQMAARGINPSSGAYQGIDRAQATETALGAAGAANNARTNLRTQAIGLQGDALNIGRGLPSQSLSALGAGVGAGSNAAGVGLGAEGNWRGNLGIMNAGFQGAGGLYGQAGAQFGNIYNNQVGMLNQQDQMAQSGTNALLGGLGTAAGLGYGIYKSDEDVKEDKREVRGVLSAVKNMRVEMWKYKDGVADGGEHIGTYAQDFQRETGLGDGKSINAIDAIGITMGAIKELADKVESLDSGKTTTRRPHSRGITRKAA
jgi:hypothetical protein